jgi:transposase
MRASWRAWRESIRSCCGPSGTAARARKADLMRIHIRAPLVEALPAEMCERLRPLLKEVEALTEKIKKLETKIEQIARTEHPETALLRQVSGAGTFDRSDVCVDAGASRALSEVP